MEHRTLNIERRIKAPGTLHGLRRNTIPRLVGTACYAVRAAFSGATLRVNWAKGSRVPPATARAGTAQAHRPYQRNHSTQSQ